MISIDEITEIYFIIDEFFKEFDKVLKEHTLEGSNKKKRNRAFVMSDSEIMTIGVSIFVVTKYLSPKSLNLYYGKKKI